MKRLRSAICTVAAGLAAAGLGLAETGLAPQDVRPASVVPKVDVVFALDTTGSMDGLLEGAKRKIWSIANEIARGQPTPDVRIGLVAYRDRGDEYVTRRLDLTGDLDRVYAELTGYRADGGGDEPEHVNQAIHEALDRMSWSDDPQALKILFVVGDAPPHEDYGDAFDHRSLAKRARQEGILVNTIRCGGSASTGRVWKSMAELAQGVFVTIDQTGGMGVTSTPFDDELAKLGTELDGTAVAYGTTEAQAEARDEAGRAGSAAAAAPAETRAARAMAKSKTRGSISYRSDLIGALEEGLVKLEDVPADQLPEEMRSMSPEQQKAFVEQKLAQRRAVRAKIRDVERQRVEHVKASAPTAAKDSFDEAVGAAIHEQGEAKGISYE